MLNHCKNNVIHYKINDICIAWMLNHCKNIAIHSKINDICIARMLNHCKNNAKNNWYICKSNTYASHQACFLCFSACNAELGSFASNVQGGVPLHLMCKACCLCSKKRFRAWYGYLHGGMGRKCIAFTSMAVHGKPSSLHRRLHNFKCNAEVQNVPQYM